MTAVAHRAPLAHTPLTRPPLLRLTKVELRKMIDTRAGFWLLLLTVLSAVAAVVLVVAVGENADQDFASLFSISVQVISILLPVVGLLAVTSEWSQRTALTTFALVPERERVVTAKLLAATALTLVAVLACLAAAAAGNLIAGGSWHIDLADLYGGALFELLGMIGALAFGLMLMHSALAIVSYFVAPTVVGILVATIHSLKGPSEWFDTGQTTPPLAEGRMEGDDWAKLAVSMAIWVALPLALGLIRLRRHEIKSG
jgi:ABC-type transport system involved in multi-copper enzyme maturation permease subunit